MTLSRRALFAAASAAVATVVVPVRIDANVRTLALSHARSHELEWLRRVIDRQMAKVVNPAVVVSADGVIDREASAEMERLSWHILQLLYERWQALHGLPFGPVGITYVEPIDDAAVVAAKG